MLAIYRVYFKQELIAIANRTRARQLRTQFVEAISVTLKSTLRVNQDQ